MRRIFAAVILLCIVYFIGGWIAVSFDLLKKEDYFAYAGIVGGLASVAGLFALTRPAISKSDVQAIELDALRSMTETAAQLQALEAARSKTKEEIGGLEIKKQEMELLVKKASLALFLKEQYSYHERQILDEVECSPRLSEHLRKAQEVSLKLAALNEEIEENPNVAQLKEIITSASRQPITVDDLIDEIPFPFNTMSRSILLISRAVSNLFLTLK
ncbi:hypothetical protein [Pseudomonas sp. GWSMS-1]|uniref:hypothetical protein n=1 Tax=Pseudomonas sp. GWSMS-1 TaxID=3308997 RepID=UPI003CF47016